MIVLSRFAYLRRRGNEMVLELPRAGALFRICDPKIAAALAMLSTPQKIKQLRRQDGFPGIELLALLVDCQILFKIDAAGGDGLRPAEGDDNLVLWDFHDLLFHTRSTEGRHANPLGGVYPYAGRHPAAAGGAAALARKENRSAQVLGRACADNLAGRKAPARTSFDARLRRPAADHARRAFAVSRRHRAGPVEMEQPARSWRRRSDGRLRRAAVSVGGSAYELELYLAVANCEGLARGFYHYDADRHALVPIGARTHELEALLAAAEFAMGAPAAPQILITIAARFGRVSWKYSSIAYALILKDVGVLIQTLYLMATDMGLGGCAIGTTNIDLFAKMTGIEFHVEGPVGQFALGRGSKPGASD